MDWTAKQKSVTQERHINVLLPTVMSDVFLMFLLGATGYVAVLALAASTNCRLKPDDQDWQTPRPVRLYIHSC